MIDDLLRMNEMLIIAYELTQIPHTDKRIAGLFYVVSFVSTCVYAQIFICCTFSRSFVRSIVCSFFGIAYANQDEYCIRVKKDLFSHARTHTRTHLLVHEFFVSFFAMLNAPIECVHKLIFFENIFGSIFLSVCIYSVFTFNIFAVQAMR